LAVGIQPVSQAGVDVNLFVVQKHHSEDPWRRTSSPGGSEGYGIGRRAGKRKREKGMVFRSALVEAH
jgi:hypothetical protein